MTRLARSLGDERLDLLAERLLEARVPRPRSGSASAGRTMFVSHEAAAVLLAAEALADALEYGPPDNDLCRCGGAGCQAETCNNPEVR